MMLPALISKLIPGPVYQVLALVALVGGILVLALLWYNAKLRSSYLAGWDAALTEVRKVNKTSADTANKARLTVRQCFDQGGSWNAIKGKCDLPTDLR